MESIKNALKELMNHHSVGGHNYDHFLAVEDHALKALKCESLDERTKLQIRLASLLHDADEPKMFKTNNNDNARTLLYLGHFDDNFIEGVIEMINLVSCSKNGDNPVPIHWMAIPRDCDRLEAIGEVGIQRCIEYNNHIKMPKHCSETPRANTIEEVFLCATFDRFKAYMNGQPSASMIDHFYDKLLHIGKASALVSQNKYILEEANRRTDVMAEFVVDYWSKN